MKNLTQDFAFALRILKRHPGFSVPAILILAAGIGVNAAVFSLVSSVLLDPLPYLQPDRLVALYSFNPTAQVDRDDISYADYRDLKDESRGFESMSAFGPTGFTFRDGERMEQVPGLAADESFFSVLGTKALHGRTFEEGDNDRSVAVLSHGFWQRRFGGDPSIVGRRLDVENESYTVIGVMPPEFRFPSRMIGMWIPFSDSYKGGSRQSRWMLAIGRLRQETSLQQGRQELLSLSQALAERHPDTNTGWRIDAEGLHDSAVGAARSGLILLQGCVFLVLLVACFNVAGLQMAGAESRRGEMAVRNALGATRRRLFRQLFSESLLLAITGAGLGLLTAYLLLGPMVGLLPRAARSANFDRISNEFLPRLEAATVDGTVFAFTALTALATAVFFGTAPLFLRRMGDLEPLSRFGGRSKSAPRGFGRSLLVSAQTAVALLLLVSAGLLTRSLLKTAAVDPGFRAGSVLVIDLSLGAYREAPQRAQVAHRLAEEVAALPGVVSTGFSTAPPFSGVDWRRPFQIVDRPSENPSPTAQYHSVGADYFSTLAIPLLEGRMIGADDNADAAPVTVISRSMAKKWWPNRSPLGEKILLGRSSWEIVGVVGDTLHQRLELAPQPEFYLPFRQSPAWFLKLVVRTDGPPERLSESVRAALWRVDGNLPIDGLTSMERLVSDSLGERRFKASLSGLFSGLALLLAAVGIYGTVSFSVALGRRELGIRMALGARRGQILRLAALWGLFPAATGLALGLPLAFLASRFWASALFGITSWDPLTYLLGALLMFTAALTACYLPARKATSVDPVQTLRSH